MAEEVIANDLKGVVTAFLLNFAISIGLLCAFSVLRPRNKMIYQPRLKFASENKKPMTMSDSVWAWIKIVYSLRPEDNMNKIGLDAVMFLIFLRFCLHLFGLLSLIAVPLCVFHYFAPTITGTKDLPEFTSNPSLNSLGITNVSPDSGLLFIHIFLIWGISFFVYYQIWRYWKTFISLRMRWFASDEFNASLHNRTLLVTRIPRKMDDPRELQRFIKKENISQAPCQVVLGRQIKELPELVKEYEEVVQKLECILVKQQKNPEKRPMHKEGGRLFGLIGGEKVDSIAFYSLRLSILEETIYSIRCKGESGYELDHSAFVFFERVKEAQKSAFQAKHKTSMTSLLKPCIKPSPMFEDILWKNIGLSVAMRNSRFYVALGFLVLLTIGWTWLVAAVSSIASIDAIAGYSAAVGNFIKNDPALSVFVQHILGPILLAILNFVLPILLFQIAFLQGVNSGSGAEKSVLYKQFFFSVYQVVILLIFSPLIMAILAILKGEQADLGTNEPFYKMILRLSAQGFVKNAAYFTSYVVTNVTGYAIDLIQGVPLILNFISRHFLTCTPRKISELKQPPKFDYTRTYGQILLMLLVGASYIVVAPVMMPFICFYFGVASMVMKYQIFYVYETKIETGGSWWPKMWPLLCLCVLFGQFVFMCVVVVFALRTQNAFSTAQAVLAALLPLTTLLFWILVSKTVAKKGDYGFHLAHDFMNENGGFSSENGGFSSENGGFSSEKNGFNREKSLEQVQHPAMVNPLMKLWLPRDMDTCFYQPKYKNLEDYRLHQRQFSDSTMKNEK